MNKFRFTIKILAIAIFMFAFASLAQAQATRTWVSGVGDDANPCSRTAPCKTWAGAISKTAPCGEIDALDPGGFGQVTITKSITLDGTGQLASILGTSGNAINIFAQPTDVVTIRGLSINGACLGGSGINVATAKTVNVEDCVIFRFTGNGITVSTSANTNLHVRNSVVRDNGGDGLNITASAGVANAVVDNCRMSGNANGVHARSGSKVSARNSVFSTNTSNGVFCDGAGATLAAVFIWSSQISGNGGNGVQAGNGGNAGASGVTIAQNQIDLNGGFAVLKSTGGVVNTFTNNSMLGNGTDACNGGVGCNNVSPGN
jgi:parallel beta helix pectate lyase-like protein